MTLRTVTATTKDTAGEPDNTEWVFCSELRGADGEIITTRPKTVKPAAGQLTVQLEPGPTMVQFGGRKWTILVPDHDEDLWTLLSVAIGVPINTSADLLAAAVETFVENNPGYPWSGVSWSESDSDAATAARQAIGTLGVPTDFLADGTGDYMVNDVVRYTDPSPSPTADFTGVYACTVDHTSGSPKDQPSRWQLVVPTSPGAIGAAPRGKTIFLETFRDGVRTDKQIIEAAFAAVAAGGEVRFGQNVTYTVTAGMSFDLSTKPGVCVNGQGATINGASVTAAAILQFGGASPGTTTTLTAAASQTTTLTVVSSAGFQAGDLVSIRSDSEVSNPDRTTYFKQEMARVAAVPDGTHITLDARTWNSYSITGHTVTVKRYVPVRNLKVRDLDVVGAGTGSDQSGVRIFVFDGATLTNVTSNGVGTDGVVYQTGINFTAEACRSEKSNRAGVGYGFHGVEVHCAKLIGCYGRGNRHSFDADEVRDLLYLGNTAEGDTSAGLSTHGNSDVVTMLANTVRDCGGGIVSRARNSRILHNIVRGTKTAAESSESYIHGISLGDDGSHPWGTGWAGTGLVIEGNDIDLTGPDLSGINAYGIYSTAPLVNARINNNKLAGFSAHGIYSKADYNNGARIFQNTMDCSAQIANMTGIILTPGHAADANVNTDVWIDLNTISGATYDGILVSGGQTTDIRTNGIKVRWNTIGHCGTNPIGFGPGYFGSNMLWHGNDIETGSTIYYTAANFSTTPNLGPVNTTNAALQVYGTNNTGAQALYTLSASAAAWTFPQRDANGCLMVATPTADGHAATKSYVDTADALKLNKSSAATKVYGTDGSGNQSMYDVKATATTWSVVQRSGEANIVADNFIAGMTTTATAAGTTTLTIDSNRTQVFTGTTTQDCVLPTTSIAAGHSHKIINNSSGTVTVKSSNGDTVKSLSAGTWTEVQALQATPTTSAHWHAT